MLEMSTENEMLRKARVRLEAIKNTGNSVEEYIYEKKDAEYLAAVYYNISKYIDEASLGSHIQVHGAIVSQRRSGRVIVLLKKVVRKFIEKLVGWYYFPIVNQQIIFNQNCVEAMKAMSEIIENQKIEIQELRKNVEN